MYHRTYGRGVVTASGEKGESVVTFNGSAWVAGKPSGALQEAVETWRANPASPLKAKHDVNYVEAAKNSNKSVEQVKRLHAMAVDSFFNGLWAGTTDKLSRSPAFRQYYYQKVGDLLPYLDPAEANAVLKMMRAAGAEKTLAPDVLKRVIDQAGKAGMNERGMKSNNKEK